MQNAIATELRHRLDLYQRIFEFCRNGSFSFARFLSFAPDRLRLAIGDSAFRIRVPVAVDPEFTRALATALTPREMPARPQKDRDLDRRALRLAQIDADLDPFEVRALLAGEGRTFLTRAARAHEKIFAEVGHGEGGEDTAFVAHLALIDALSRAVEPTLAQRLSALAMFDLSMQAWLAQNHDAPDALSLRLGLKCTALLSPLAFGIAADDFVKRPVSWYRTTPDAVRFARRVILDPIETIDLGRVLIALTERILVDDAAKQAIIRDTLLELARDAMLAIAILEPKTPDALAQAIRSQQALMLAVLNSRRRTELLRELRTFSASKAAEALIGLLNAAERVAAGDAAPLGLHGDPRERTKLAVIGAVVLALDEKAEELRAQLLHRIEHVPETEGAYHISDDDAPLYSLEKGGREALLYIDAKSLAARIANIGGRAAGETLARVFHRALIDRATALRGIEVAHVAAESLLFRGDVVAMIELAIALKKIVDDVRRDVEKEIPELFGGTSRALAEADEELRDLEDRRARIDDAIARAFGEGGSLTYLQDARALIEERIEAVLAMKETRVKKRAPVPPAVGAMLAVAQAPEEIDVGGGRTICFSPIFEDLIRGTARNQVTISSEALAMWRKARGTMLRFEEHVERGERTLTAYARDVRELRAKFRFVEETLLWEIL